ncbi:MAG: outer membrane beta-barrel protein [Bacteroidia bacterium]|nr:outer membrane beta-barrel protein [Bacteroidia bacterium]
MKKLLLLTLIGFISYTSIAQEGILVGPKYSINTTWLFDQDEYESNTYNYGFTLGSMKGVNVGFQFSPKYGAEIDLFSTSHNQKYLNSSPTSEMYYIEKLKYFDIATYFRVRSEQSATYFMIGPKFSFFNKALIFTHSDNGDESKLPVAKDEDIYNKLNVFIELAYGLEAELVEDKLTF